MNIAIYSLFRDNAGPYIDRYFNRLLAQTYPMEELRVYAVEGDSEDNTYQHLLEDANYAVKRSLRTQVYTVKTGIERYGSVVHERRFQALSQTANVALDAIAEDKWADYILLIESDLLFRDDLIERLAAHADGHNVVAPTILAGGVHYDTWGFRFANGNWINPFGFYNGVLEMLSVGSVTLYPAKPIYMGVRFDLECMRGLCNRFVRHNHRIIWDTSIIVNHPL